MKTSVQRVSTGENWPPEEGEVVTFKSSTGQKSGVLKEVRWGLVWRDFILEDGRAIPEHRVVGCPESPTWRSADEVSQEEREAYLRCPPWRSSNRLPHRLLPQPRNRPRRCRPARR